MSAASAFPLAVFQIIVKTIEGKTIMLNVTPSMTIAEVMQLIAEKLNAMRWKARLSYSSQTLNDSMCISDYNIQAGSTLFEDGRLRGGSPNGFQNDVPMASGISSFADDEILAEVMKRPAVLNAVATKMVNNQVIMQKMMCAWVPQLPDIPNIDDKNATCLN